MSVKIRLAREGRKNSPSFKIVVMNTRDKRNGRYLDILGYYNPSTQPADYQIDEEKYNQWIQNGALISDAVKQIKDGEYKHVPYNPKVDEAKDQKEDKVEDSAEELTEATAEEAQEEETEQVQDQEE